MPKQEWWGYKIRAEFAKSFLSGRGIEIGPGMNPQALPEDATALYFDKCSADEIKMKFDEGDVEYDLYSMDRVKELFPEGADFLIAHQVLEHTPSEIAALEQWHTYVKDGGIVVLSVPDKDFTAGDADRISPSYEHLLLDYLLARNESSFESCEHSYGFVLNWDACGWAQTWKHMDRETFPKFVLRQARAEGKDFHWHALNRDLWDRVIASAALFGGRKIEMLAKTYPGAQEEWVTQGEIIYIYRISRGDGIVGLPHPREELSQIYSKIEAARGKLSQLMRF